MSLALQPTLPTPAFPATALPAHGPRSAFAGPIAAVRRRLSARRTRLALSALDDRALADIGLRRCDIRDACARP